MHRLAGLEMMKEFLGDVRTAFGRGEPFSTKVGAVEPRSR